MEILGCPGGGGVGFGVRGARDERRERESSIYRPDKVIH